MIYEQLICSKNQLLQEIAVLNEEIAALPKGKLIAKSCGKYRSYYISNKSSPQYIPRKDYEFAQKLALKKYKLALLTEKEASLSVISKAINSLSAIVTNSSNLLSDFSPYCQILRTCLGQASTKMSEWAAKPYEFNSSHPENLIHQTLSNRAVRSKSEVIIANALFQNNIPYRYECKMALGDVTVYPDFTIMHPVTEKIFYWEHFGMMDNPAYRNAAFSKLRTYGDYGIIPSINLITTYETLDCPLNSKEINELILRTFM